PGATAPALVDASVELHSGESTVVLGHNGSGKSTLATLLAGPERPDTGTVTVRGSDRPLHRWRARDLVGRVGTVFQHPEHQFLTGTVRDEVMAGPRRARLPDTWSTER